MRITREEALAILEVEVREDAARGDGNRRGPLAGRSLACR
jgi:hypothetical protein